MEDNYNLVWGKDKKTKQQDTTSDNNHQEPLGKL